MCIDCNTLWKGIFFVGLFISLLIIMEIRKVLVRKNPLKENIRAPRTEWNGPWIPVPIQEPVKGYNILYFNLGKKLEVNLKH